MHITRCRDQKSRTLDEFYSDLSVQENPVSRESGNAMLSLLTRLRARPEVWRAFGLTSHHRLCFHAEDDYRSPSFVTISVLDQRNYFVEYLMPERLAPWPNAYVKGEATPEEEAIAMVVRAMEQSGGWSKSSNAD
jgi:hypothetical protein